VILIMFFFLSKKWIIVYFKFHMLCREQCWSPLACGMGQKDLVIYLPGSFIQKPWINWCIFSLIQPYLLEVNIIWLWSLASPWLLHITFLLCWSPTIQWQLDKILWGRQRNWFIQTFFLAGPWQNCSTSFPRKMDSLQFLFYIFVIICLATLGNFLLDEKIWCPW